MTEQELGLAMIAHEGTIDRSYMHVNNGGGWYVKPFPHRTPRATAIIRWMYDRAEGNVFELCEIPELHRLGTVHAVTRKLVECGGLTKLPIMQPRGNSRRYTVTASNREVMAEILYDDYY
tara:strand:- start:21 stop:380 length:360 start_codon:yes stop_codon:yes gene_type:complete